MPHKPTRPQVVRTPREPDDIFTRARNTIHGARQQDYGDKLENFSQIAAIWNGILARKLNTALSPADVGLLMIGMKAARLSHMPTHADSLLDIAGYAGCIETLIQEWRDGATLPGILQDLNNVGGTAYPQGEL